MITIVPAQEERDLRGILQLQKANLAVNLSSSEAAREGFVTVVHSYDQLLALNLLEKHLIAKEGDEVVAYILAMTEVSKRAIPVLIPMFEIFERTQYAGKRLSDYPSVVVGQVCVHQRYRGTGLFDQCYRVYKTHYSKRYSLAITEIAASNTRSLRAHQRIGFERIHSYTAPDGVAWEIVVWDWRQAS